MVIKLVAHLIEIGTYVNFFLMKISYICKIKNFFSNTKKKLIMAPSIIKMTENVKFDSLLENISLKIYIPPTTQINYYYEVAAVRYALKKTHGKLNHFNQNSNTIICIADFA